ncbi:MAG: zinc-dependent metalloprotease family protein, partial [Pyrinomonadaceae bacterium]
VFAIFVVFLFSLVAVSAQQSETSPDGVWRKIDDTALRQDESIKRTVIPESYQTFQLDKAKLGKILKQAPMEFMQDAVEREVTLHLPMPDGTFEPFRIEKSPIMAEELAEKYPEIQSFRGQGIENRLLNVRFDISPNGFHAQILSEKGAILIEPYAVGDTLNYIAFFKHNVLRLSRDFVCHFKDENLWELKSFDIFAGLAEVSNGTQLRTYRLALATTGEYTNYFRQPGDTDQQAKVRALAAVNTTMNRVNQVYERDLAIRMVLIPNNDLLIYTDPNTDPYTNNNGAAMLSQNQSNIDTVIGTENYDIGHVFSTGGGGIATLNGPCGPDRARGVTGLPDPVGDPFAIDYVA